MITLGTGILIASFQVITYYQVRGELAASLETGILNSPCQPVIIYSTALRKVARRPNQKFYSPLALASLFIHGPQKSCKGKLNKNPV